MEKFVFETKINHIQDNSLLVCGDFFYVLAVTTRLQEANWYQGISKKINCHLESLKHTKRGGIYCMEIFLLSSQGIEHSIFKYLNKKSSKRVCFTCFSPVQKRRLNDSM